MEKLADILIIAMLVVLVLIMFSPILYAYYFRYEQTKLLKKRLKHIAELEERMLQACETWEKFGVMVDDEPEVEVNLK